MTIGLVAKNDPVGCNSYNSSNNSSSSNDNNNNNSD